MFGLIEDQVLAKFKRFQDLQPGMAVLTPNGTGIVAGKHIYEGRMEILVDHGDRLNKVVIVCAYSVDQVQEGRYGD